jgi:hypothetical protein
LLRGYAPTRNHAVHRHSIKELASREPVGARKRRPGGDPARKEAAGRFFAHEALTNERITGDWQRRTGAPAPRVMSWRSTMPAV